MSRKLDVSSAAWFGPALIICGALLLLFNAFRDRSDNRWAYGAALIVFGIVWTIVFMVDRRRRRIETKNTEVEANRIAPPCDTCGRPVDQYGEASSIFLEVLGPKDEQRFAGFCSQEHAAQWMARPLPAAEPEDEHTSGLSTRDRLENMGVAAAVLVTLCLMGLGVYTAFRLILGW